MDALEKHLQVTRHLGDALWSKGTNKLDCRPTLEFLKLVDDLEAVVLFTCPDESEPDCFEIHDTTAAVHPDPRERLNH